MVVFFAEEAPDFVDADIDVDVLEGRLGAAIIVDQIVGNDDRSHAHAPDE
jgi:hypothetical protein